VSSRPGTGDRSSSTASTYAPPGRLTKKIVLGVTGSVGAAAAIPRFLIVLRKLFTDEVTVLLSKSGRRFVSPYVATLFSGRPCVADPFSADPFLVPHIQSTEGADILIIMPATANIIGKAANGICDELISTAIVAATCPVLFVPSMNEAMWNKAVVQRNIQFLKDSGHHIVDPTWGTEIGGFVTTFGAMPPFVDIIKAIGCVLGLSLSDQRSEDNCNNLA
jgi:phosphopantothenoylcysteine decarboxylase